MAGRYLWQVSPHLSISDIGNVRLMDIKFESNRSMRLSFSASNVEHLRFCEFGSVLFFSLKPSSFGDHIRDVVEMGPEEKMFRIHASSHIAGVANEEVSRNRDSGRQGERESMRENLYVPDRKPSVALAMQLSGPEPTRGRSVFVDEVPESILRGKVFESESLSAGARAADHSFFSMSEFCAAMRTDLSKLWLSHVTSSGRVVRDQPGIEARRVPILSNERGN